MTGRIENPGMQAPGGRCGGRRRKAESLSLCPCSYRVSSLFPVFVLSFLSLFPLVLFPTFCLVLNSCFVSPLFYLAFELHALLLALVLFFPLHRNFPQPEQYVT
jgi:hypothetical protein